MEQYKTQLKNSRRRRSRLPQEMMEPKLLRHAPRPVKGQTCFDLNVGSEVDKGDAKGELPVLPVPPVA